MTASMATSEQIMNLGRRVDLESLTSKCHVFRFAIKQQNLLPVMPSSSQYDTSRLNLHWRCHSLRGCAVILQLFCSYISVASDHGVLQHK